MKLIACILTILISLPIGANEVPVMATKHLDDIATDTVRLCFDLNISKGWHVYSTSLPDGGPISAEITFDSIQGIKPVGPLMFQGKEIEVDDQVFLMKLRYFEQSVRFYQNMQISKADWKMEGTLTYGVCNDLSCMPPQHIEFCYTSGDDTDQSVSQTTSAIDNIDKISGFDSVLWAPVSYQENQSRTSDSLWGLFLISFLGGLIALFTPCVWPIIPMTVSFFIKRSVTRGKAIRDAILYGISIIAVYITLALAITLIFGANALNALSTNAVVNILFFLILVAFALSFFGLFDITLPSGWSTGTDRRSKASGLGGIFFMALTLTIVSFSCTGPIIGFLLVDAASTGNILAPTVGMLGFSAAMAIPFTLFALFPQWLQSIPKSGEWMNRIKVTLGVIELAFSLKFLSVADMAYGWGILPRDLFILLWILMALFLGLYLTGIIKRRTGSKTPKKSPVAIIAGILSTAFAAWLIPGLWGAPLKAISAFTPPMNTQIIGYDSKSLEPQFTDYNEALKESARTGKPVLIDFTGYGCVNCRKMEASVWTDQQVSEIIQNKYILVSLYVDDRTPLDQPIYIVENGKKIKIRSVGDKWSLLQRYKFGANAQPFYVIVDSQGNLKNGPYTFDPDPDKFIKFLL